MASIWNVCGNRSTMVMRSIFVARRQYRQIPRQCSWIAGHNRQRARPQLEQARRRRFFQPGARRIGQHEVRRFLRVPQERFRLCSRTGLMPNRARRALRSRSAAAARPDSTATTFSKRRASGSEKSPTPA